MVFIGRTKLISSCVGIDTPAYGYFQSLWTTPLNWAYYTVAQPNVNNREIYWPRGKVLGGWSPLVARV